MPKKLKIIIAVACVIVLGLSLFFGLYYGIKPMVTLDYGYVSPAISGIAGLYVVGNRKYPTEMVSVTRDSYFAPIRPQRTGYTFEGWYKDSACTVPWVNEVDRVKSDITLYAKWARIAD